MNDLASLFAMGRYGAYVWPAYGLTFAAFAWMAGQTVVTLRRRRQEERDMGALSRPRRARPGHGQEARS